MMKNPFKWICGLLGVLAAAAVFGIIWVGWNLNQALAPIESLSQYESVLADWKASGLVDHFPAALPAARKASFSAFPGFLQGGGHIQLRITLPEAEVRRHFDHAVATAKQYHDGGDSSGLLNEQDGGLPSTSPHTLGSDRHEFPDDYRVFIFDAKPHGIDSDQPWNHGMSRGVVVSLQRNEVIYYAEKW